VEGDGFCQTFLSFTSTLFPRRERLGYFRKLSPNPCDV
jgi:hypothetical protein